MMSENTDVINLDKLVSKPDTNSKQVALILKKMFSLNNSLSAAYLVKASIINVSQNNLCKSTRSDLIFRLELVS